MTRQTGYTFHSGAELFDPAPRAETPRDAIMCPQLARCDPQLARSAAIRPAFPARRREQ